MAGRCTAEFTSAVRSPADLAAGPDGPMIHFVSWDDAGNMASVLWVRDKNPAKDGGQRPDCSGS